MNENNAQISLIFENGIIALKNQRYQEALEDFSFCYDNEQLLLIYQDTLCLHILGLLYFKIGKPEKGAGFLFSASMKEKKLGETSASKHTTHQIELIKHLQGDLSRALDYYKSTYENLKKIKQVEGMALCLKTLGELLLLDGNLLYAAKSWNFSYKLFDKIGIPEKETLSKWISYIE